ncbi:SRPBCC family protein [Kribbella sp. CA-253562]|uniref:SRPBCC family protein n=1 Tax=Kribbella sp. CA-253562 TaxID=3239942 RepID=UPI003D8A74AD
MDILEQITAVQREVSRTGEIATVLMRRTYQSGPEDVWDALTDPERMARWFSPVTGELKVGGSFQIQGNAGGEILECEPPKRYKVTFGGPESLLEVRLTPGPGDTTEFELEHSMANPPAPGGAGALYVGPGWDGAVAGLALYLNGDLGEDVDPVKMANSPEVIEYNAQCIHAWTEAIRASGTTTEKDLEETVAVAMAHYAPENPPEN